MQNFAKLFNYKKLEEKLIFGIKKIIEKNSKTLQFYANFLKLFSNFNPNLLFSKIYYLNNKIGFYL